MGVVTGRRLLTLLLILAAIGIPAGVLQALCVGSSCDSDTSETARVPFCPLPDALKRHIVNGYYEGRSPDVIAVTTPGIAVAGPQDSALGPVPWPSVGDDPPATVPIVFWGTGVRPGAAVPDGTVLDGVAPTVSEILGFERPFPEVRSGKAIPGVASGDRPRLVFLVVWQGVGGSELEATPDAWPYFASLLQDGAGTLSGDTGSLPLDPAATLTTIGTGGLPSQHGITGSLVRNDDGVVAPAFGAESPVTVIATLADDLDQANRNRSLVGLVAPNESGRGLIGGAWYPDADLDDTVISRRADPVNALASLLDRGYGRDDVPDILGVVLDDDLEVMDGKTRALVRQAGRAARGSLLVVVAGTGSVAGRDAIASAVLTEHVEAEIPGDDGVLTAAVPGGLFLDSEVLTEQAITGQAVVEAVLSASNADGERMMADAFQGFAVSFARYC